jgi:hypothetical protein
MIQSNWVARLIWGSAGPSEAHGVSFGDFHITSIIRHYRESLDKIEGTQIPKAIHETLDMLADGTGTTIRLAWNRAYGVRIELDEKGMEEMIERKRMERETAQKDRLSKFLSACTKTISASIRRTLPAEGRTESAAAPPPPDSDTCDALDDEPSFSSSKSKKRGRERDEQILEEKIHLAADFNSAFLRSGGKSNQYKDYMRLICLIQLNCYIRAHGCRDVSIFGQSLSVRVVLKNARDAFFLFSTILLPKFSEWLYTSSVSSGKSFAYFECPTARDHLKQYVDIYVGSYLAKLLNMNIDNTDKVEDGIKKCPIDEFVSDCRYHYFMILQEEYNEMHPMGS